MVRHYYNHARQANFKNAASLKKLVFSQVKTADCFPLFSNYLIAKMDFLKKFRKNINYKLEIAMSASATVCTVF